jgi:hypothetical protein
MPEGAQVPPVITQPQPVSAPPPPQAPVKNPPRRPNILILVVAIVGLILASFGIVSYLLSSSEETHTDIAVSTTPTLTTTQSQNPEQTLKVYQGKGYMFNYPATWSVEGPEANDSSVYFRAPEKFGDNTEPTQYYVSLTELPNSNDETFTNIATEGLTEEVKQAFKFTKSTKDGITTYLTESLPSRSGNLAAYLTKDEKKYVLLSLNPYDSGEPFESQNKYFNLFNEFLQSFKFTE